MTFTKGHLQYNTGKTWLKKGHHLNKGRKLTEEHKNKLSIVNKGNKPWNAGLKGIHLSPKTEFKKGIETWNKGIKFTKEQKSCLNLSGLDIGHGLNKGKKCPKISGKNHWNWQGGITPESMKRTTDLKWKELVKIIYKRDNWTCQKCGLHIHDSNISCHHIIPFSVCKTDDPNNLITLCRSCHGKEDYKFMKTNKGRLESKIG